MEVHKTFVTLDNVATITCPKCHKAKNISVGKYRSRKHNLKVRCSCSHSFSALLDFRRHYRKESNLEGSFSMVSPAFGAGRLNILNISRSGVGFTVGFSVNGRHTMKLGQKARISFELDNRKQTTIDKIVIIRNIFEQYIGCEFDDTGTLEKDLGFYLQP
jgi:hypothetical protein